MTVHGSDILHSGNKVGEVMVRLSRTRGRPSATAHRLGDASLSPNTRRAYACALSQLDAWLDGEQFDRTGLVA